MNTASSDNPSVRLTGMADGLRVVLDPKQPIDFLQSELNRLFKPLGHLAINTRVLLDYGEAEEWEGAEEMTAALEGFLKVSFGVGTVVRPPKKRREVEEILRHRDMDRSWQNHRSDVLMLTGRVRSGQKVTARKHLLILGDVNPGGEVVAGGDILVIGTLSGTAAAGQPDREDAIVLSLDFRPTQVQIGTIVAAGLPSSPTKQTEYAYVEDNTIVVEDYLEADPFGRLPWPEVR